MEVLYLWRVKSPDQGRPERPELPGGTGYCACSTAHGSYSRWERSGSRILPRSAAESCKKQCWINLNEWIWNKTSLIKFTIAQPYAQLKWKTIFFSPKNFTKKLISIVIDRYETLLRQRPALPDSNETGSGVGSDSGVETSLKIGSGFGVGSETNHSGSTALAKRTKRWIPTDTSHFTEQFCRDERIIFNTAKLSFALVE